MLKRLVMGDLHRKLKKTFNEFGHAHYLTYSCYQRLPLLSKDVTRQWVIDAMAQVRFALHVQLWAYVIMPEHVHLLLYPNRFPYDMSHILAALKRPVAADAKAHLIAHNELDWLGRLTVKRGKRETF